MGDDNTGARSGVATVVDSGESHPVSDHLAVAQNPLRVLVADDSSDNRLLIDLFLKKSGYHLDEAENGEVAVKKFRENRYDLVLMDIQMPVMDGYAATREIRAWENEQGRPRTPIIALTASILDEAVGKSYEAGCDTHVSKPVRRKTLMASIEEVITSKSSVTQSSDAASAAPPRHNDQRRKLREAATVAKANPGPAAVFRR